MSIIILLHSYSQIKCRQREIVTNLTQKQSGIIIIYNTTVVASNSITNF